MGQQAFNLKLSAEKCEQLLSVVSARPDGRYNPVHENIIIELKEKEIHAIADSPDSQLKTWCVFDMDYFDEVHSGESSSHLLLNSTEVFDLLSAYSEDNTDSVEIMTRPSTGNQLFTEIQLSSAELNYAGSYYSERNQYWKSYWNPNNNFDSDGNPLFSNGIDEQGGASCFVQVSSEEVDQKIIKVVQKQEGAKKFPFIVVNNKLLTDVYDRRGNRVWGELESERVTGYNIQNHYGDKFKNIFRTTDGIVDIWTSYQQPIFVESQTEEYVVRHWLSPVE